MGSSSSDAWVAPKRPVFLRLLEETSGPAETPAGPLAGRYHLVERAPATPPVRRWLAQQTRAGGLSRLVRLEQLPPEAPDRAAWRAALLDEAAALTAVDHPNVVALLDVVEGEAGLLLVREHVDGATLAEALSLCAGAGAGVPMDLAVYLASEIAWVLHAVHAASDAGGRPLGLVHRGVHPSQVWLTRSGHVKLDGFHLVRMRAGRRPATEPGLVKGFAAYLPPECIAGEPAGAAADVYAVGVMLFELLTGEPCFDGDNAADVLWKVVREGVPIERLEQSRVPPELRAIVERATQPSPEDRFESAAQMAHAFDAYAEVIRRHGRPWQVARYFEAQGLFAEPAASRLSEVRTALVDREPADPRPTVRARDVDAFEAVRGAARVSAGLAGAGDEITEVTRRGPAPAPAPSVETLRPAPTVDVSDLDLADEDDALELVDDVDIVLIDP